MQKHAVLIAILIWLSSSALTQAKERWYYNENWIRTQDEQNASFYRDIEFDKKGKPKGKIKDYFISGELQGEGYAYNLDPFDDSKSTWEGKLVVYYKNGKKANERHYVKGALEGENRSWYENGQLQSRMNFRNDKREGKLESWYADGKILMVGYFKNNLGNGLWQEWHENGRLKRQFTMIEDKREGLYQEWYDNGVSMTKMNMVGDEPDGEVMGWHPNGKMRYHGFYKQGMKTGIHRRWYEDGALEFQGAWENNREEGIHRSFHPNGEIADDISYHEGREQTTYRSWYQNGQNQSEIPFINGKREGTATFWYENGQKMSEFFYRNNLQEEWSSVWDESGKIRRKGFFHNDKLSDKQWIIFDEYGRSWKEFNENFSDTTNPFGWPIESNEKSTKLIMSDSAYSVYGVSSFTDQTETAGINIPYQDPGLDFTLETNVGIFMAKNEPFYYGIYLGFRDWQNHWSFVINQKKQFRITHYLEGIEVEGSGWQSCEDIQPTQSNTLKVIKLDGEAMFFINGQTIWKAKFSQLYGNEFGFVVSPGKTMIADYFQIKDFSSPVGYSDEAGGWMGNGSGILIHENGYILTNYHVIEKAREIQITWLDSRNREQTFNASLERSDPQNDLAILKISDKNYNRVKELPYIINYNTAQVGETVFTLGFPHALSEMGKEVKVTDGLISALTGYQDDISTYQISVPVQAGNSGGPLFNKKGELVGIVNAKIYGMDNVSYAIKSNYIKNLIDLLPGKPRYVDKGLGKKPLTDQIGILKPFVVMIKIR